ncbi:ATP-binding cassette domain-containing protein [Agromyces humatus]|uniref:Daunorubicin resistance protein DrrA family ABC transporter ATP-binding protein n=1 Tax=Agromyces humatus TaxID=279573 RepID=A0ABP4WYI5_9MICO|nr:ATP-binding cassette domain-containing protein [Agromyces humatus]
MSIRSNDQAVEADGLVKSFGDVRAVDGIDLRVATGSVYGVLGPNGAGKTTMISMLATLAPPDEGTARVFGHDVRREPQVVRQLIGLTGQYASLDEALSGAENLVLFCRLQGLRPAAARRKAAELLEEFGLTDAARKPVTQYSGGMRRRLDLAASLIAQPPLIFLDEPTTGLDPRTRAQMWATIRRLVATGSTVLLTTQYLDEADQLADRIAVIDHGRVVAEGTTDELKASVGASSLQLHVDEVGDLDDAASVLERVLGVRPTVTHESKRLTAPMQDADRVGELLAALRESRIRLTELSVSKPTLDEVFLTLTGHGVEPGRTDDRELADEADAAASVDLEGSRA